MTNLRKYLLRKVLLDSLKCTGCYKRTNTFCKVCDINICLSCYGKHTDEKHIALGVRAGPGSKMLENASVDSQYDYAETSGNVAVYDYVAEATISENSSSPSEEPVYEYIDRSPDPLPMPMDSPPADDV